MSKVIGRRILFSAALLVVSGGCALGRPHVKSLRDAGAGRIQFDRVVDTTVAALNALHPKCGPVLDHRDRDEEYRVYSVVGRIARAKRERDQDIHIVLDDPDDSTQHMVVELDDPDFRGNTVSPYRDKLAAARGMFEDLLPPSAGRQLTDLRGMTVRVTGVGFFDMKHFQVGRSRSCIELHPILAIERVGIDPSGPRTSGSYVFTSRKAVSTGTP